MGDEGSSQDSGNRFNRSTTKEGKLKKDGDEIPKKSRNIKDEPKTMTSNTKGKKPSATMTRTLSRESESGERRSESLASVAAAAKAGRQLKMQMKNAKKDERKGSKLSDKEEKPSASAAKLSESEETPNVGVGFESGGVGQIKTEHSTLIELLRRRRERKEKDSIRTVSKEEDPKIKDTKQSDKDGKEKEVISPVILGNEKAKAEEPHLLHVGTPFEVSFKLNLFPLIFVIRFVPFLDRWWIQMQPSFHLRGPQIVHRPSSGEGRCREAAAACRGDP